MAVLVIALALLRVTEHAVRFRGFLELLFRFRIAGIAVWMELHGQLTVRALDLLLRGRAGHAQYFVIVAFCLCCQENPLGNDYFFFATRTIAGRSSRSLMR